MAIYYEKNSGLRSEQDRVNEIKKIESLPGKTKIVGNSDDLLRAMSDTEPGGKILLKGGVYGDKDFHSKVPYTHIYSDLTESPIEEIPRPVFKNSRLILWGKGSSLSRVAFNDNGNTTKSNLIQIRGIDSSILGITFANLKPASRNSPLIVLFSSADNAIIRNCEFRNLFGLNLTLREDLEGKVATNVIINNNLFVDCHDYFLQAGQYGLPNKDAFSSFGNFSYNKVINCRSAELKVSDFTVSSNSFTNLKQGFNLRHGDRNKIHKNLYRGGDYAGRIFGEYHSISGNIVLNPLLYSFGLPTGSLKDQFRVLNNANHVVSKYVEFTDNYLTSGLQSVFKIGDPQPGKLGMGSSREPKSPDYTHYEPYTPSNILIKRNVLDVGMGVPFYLHNPDTVPNNLDGYPIESLSGPAYLNVRSKDNTIFFSNEGKEDPDAYKYMVMDDVIVSK